MDVKLIHLALTASLIFAFLFSGCIGHGGDTDVNEPSNRIPTWQWQLQGEINTSFEVNMYDIDLEETPASTIDALHLRGITVICYFSAGSWEEYRDDAHLFEAEVVGEPLDEWPDERWLDISNYGNFSNIIEARLDLAVQKGCDGVEPDNVEGYVAESGFNLTYADQLAYNTWLSEEAHLRNLTIGLKNDLEQVDDLVTLFDFAVNEQCFQYDECELLLPFNEMGKQVYGVEYELEPEEFCLDANEMGFSWLKMEYPLDGGRIGCEGFAP